MNNTSLCKDLKNDPSVILNERNAHNPESYFCLTEIKWELFYEVICENLFVNLTTLSRI